MAHKFNLGEWVCIKKDADHIRIKDNIGFAWEMKEYLGQQHQIMTVEDRDTYWGYRLKGVEDHCTDYHWLWHEDWLEPIEEKQIKISENDIMDLFN